MDLHYHKLFYGDLAVHMSAWEMITLEKILYIYCLLYKSTAIWSGVVFMGSWRHHWERVAKKESNKMTWKQKLKRNREGENEEGEEESKRTREKERVKVEERERESVKDRN